MRGAGSAGQGGRRERRLEKRTRQRISCKLRVEGREHSGIVLDVSRRGMFVQTKARAAPGTPAVVELSLAGRAEPLVVEAQVARLERVPPAVAVIWTSGLGLSVSRPPAAWLELVTAFGAGAARVAAPQRPEPPDLEQSFCVRAALIQGTRTRTLLVRCGSESAARELALAELGDEWKILTVQISRS